MISIVIPVYNVDRFLRRCLESVVNQTFKEWECILVDDGSEDNSGDICDEYASLDSRFKVIHKSNSGANDSRRIGFIESTGEYIIFIDSDDYMEHNMLSKLYEDIVINQSDISICAWFTDSPKSVVPHKLAIPYSVIEERNIIEQYIIPSSWGAPGKFCIPSFWCIRLVKRCLILESFFVSDRVYLPEDLISQIELAYMARKVSIINTPLYHYCINPASITNSYNRNNLDMRLKCYDYVINLFKRKKVWCKDLSERMNYFLVCALHNAMTNISRLNSYHEAKNEIMRVYSYPQIKRLMESYDFSQCDLQKKIIFYSFKTNIYWFQYKYIRWRLKKQY